MPNQIQDQARWKVLDRYARKVPRYYASDTRHLLSYLLKPATNDREKVRLIYSWLIANVVYSHGAHLGDGFFTTGSLAGLNEHGLACDGYGLMFQRLASDAGLEVRTIEGFARDGDRRPQPVSNHLWDAVKIDGRWWLVDPTWAAGSVSGSTFRSDPDDYFFLAPLDAFALSHYDFKDEFGTQRRLGLTWNEFASMPNNVADLVYAGFSVSQVLQHFKINKGASAVKTFNQPMGQFDAHRMPLGFTLRKSQATFFSMASDFYTDVAVVQDSHWSFMKKSGDRFEIHPDLQPGDLLIMGRPKHSSDFEALLEYRVK